MVKKTKISAWKFMTNLWWCSFSPPTVASYAWVMKNRKLSTSVIRWWRRATRILQYIILDFRWARKKSRYKHFHDNCERFLNKNKKERQRRRGKDHGGLKMTSCSEATPVINRHFNGFRFRWSHPRVNKVLNQYGIAGSTAPNNKREMPT